MSLALSHSACREHEGAKPRPVASRPAFFGRPLALRGVSLAGAEFGVDTFGQGTLPGVVGVNYFYPDPAFSKGYTSADYFRARGLNTFRIPFRWERLQPTRRSPLDFAELSRLKTTTRRLTEKGAYVVLDVHNYGRFKSGVLGAEIPYADFADLWGRLSLEFKDNPKVVFALMNEPHDMPTEHWVDAANAAIASIRRTGATNLLLVPGNGYSGAHSWTQSSYGTPNGVALLAIEDPRQFLAFEVHQHLDDDSSGKSPTCSSPDAGAQRMRSFTHWLRAHGKMGFLGEFSAGPGTVCARSLGNLLAHLEENKDVYVGWTYWAAGPSWGSYFASIEPRDGRDATQMVPLEAHLRW